MSKPRRNDPCPCGSGLKYKRCCMDNSNSSVNLTLFQQDLDVLHKDLITYAITNYEEELVELVNKSSTNHIEDTNTTDLSTYSYLLHAWAIFNLPVEDDKTIYDLFYEENHDAIYRPTVKQTFKDWESIRPGVYETFPKADYIELVDLMTGDTFTMPHDPLVGFAEGRLAVGGLIPYLSSHKFFYALTQLDGSVKGQVMELLEGHTPESFARADVFPDLLGQILQTKNVRQLPQLEWLDESHEEVAKTFTIHAKEKDYEKELVDATVSFWNDFCELTEPKIFRTNGHAAALDYFSQVFFSSNDVTQGQLAKEYETSAGTISKHYRTMVDEFDAVLEMNESKREAEKQ